MSGTLTTLVDFNTAIEGYADGLVVDANGNLLGTCPFGGLNDDGMVYEIAKTASGYASTPTVLINFNGTDGIYPRDGLIADAEGDLFGTTNAGSTSAGYVYEIANFGSGYATVPTLLSSIDEGISPGYWPEGGLVADANGDLFGTTDEGGTYDDGTIFEITKTAGAYAMSPKTLFNFNGYDGSGPVTNLIVDAQGDLFGTMDNGGANNSGFVFELQKYGDYYANAPTTLVSLPKSGYEFPFSNSLLTDANGDLFGTIMQGGPSSFGTLYEIAKTAAGYANTPDTLVNFDSSCFNPVGGLIADADGNLFGITEGGGTSGYGTVFEIAKTANGYASTPTVVVSFDVDNGGEPSSGLTADADGNLFGTRGGDVTSADGSVFEITNSGFVPKNPVCLLRGTLLATPCGEVPVETIRPGDEISIPGGPARVRWVGHRTYNGRFLAGNHLGLPVTIKADALGDGVPRRDVHVSPGHGIWLEGLLIPSWRLINGVSVCQAASVERVEYFNVELEEHGILFAHGALVESFLDDGEFRNQFQNAAEYHELYPDTSARHQVKALPRLEEGFNLAAIQARINCRAGLRGKSTTFGMLHGFVDEISDDGLITGWAQDVSAPEAPVVLTIFAGKRFIAMVLANAYRADLRREGLGSGCHGFTFRLPDGYTHPVVVQGVVDRNVLKHVETTSRQAAR